MDLCPVTVPGDCRDRPARVLNSYTQVLFDQPSLARSALVTSLSGTHYLNLGEAVLALL